MVELSSDRANPKGRASEARPAWDVVALVAAAAVLLGVALTRDTVTFARLGKSPEVYSIPGGVLSLWEDGTPALAAIVFLFSIAYPAFKLAALAWLSLRPKPSRAQSRLLSILRHLGRASFLDVFLIGLFVTSIQGPLAKAESHDGIGFFLAAVLLSMVAAARLAQRRKSVVGLTDPVRAGKEKLQSRGARALSLVSAALFLASSVQTILTVKIGPFFEHDLELTGGFALLWERNEVLLAAAGFLFVFAASAARVLFSMKVRLRPTDRTVRWLVRFDEWAMLEVYALALVILRVKLEELANVELRAGYGLVLAAGVLGHCDALWIRRASGR